jgi:hypothetical protein
LCSFTSHISHSSLHILFPTSYLILHFVSHSPLNISFPTSYIILQFISYSPFTYTYLIHHFIPHSTLFISFSTSYLIHHYISHSPIHISFTTTYLIHHFIYHSPFHGIYMSLGSFLAWTLTKLNSFYEHWKFKKWKFYLTVYKLFSSQSLHMSPCLLFYVIDPNI